MSQTKLLIQLISSLTDSEFDYIAKKYLIEVEGFDKVVNCNGPHDKGLDMRNASVSEMQVQYQATTTRQKDFDAKLRKDLSKAQNNVSDYGLPKRVVYFYSYPITNRAVLELKKMAKRDFNIILDIIAAETISEISQLYEAVKEEILLRSEFDKIQIKSDFFNDPKVRAFYDLMSIGSATDIKYNIIKSFIISYLNTNGPTNHYKILDTINKQFETTLADEYFQSILRRMNTEQKIKKSSASNLELTENEKERIEKVLDEFKIEEAFFRKKISNVLMKYQIGELIEDIILQLIKLYESSYSINISEFTYRNSTIHDLETATQAFIDFLIEKSIPEDKSELLISELLEIADQSSILSRIAAGEVFSKVSDPDRLQDYILQHHHNKVVFLDTNVLINLLLAHYNSNSDYNDYHYKVAKQFLSFVRENDLTLLTIRRYALETTRIFIDALQLIPFTKLPYFNALGKTSNILYNFYLHLSDWNLLDEGIKDFEDFLLEFKFKYEKLEKGDSFRSQMEYLLDTLGVEIEEIEYEYNLDKARELIDLVLKKDNKYKSHFATSSDAIMIRRLADPDVDVNPIEPIFCTWDFGLIKLRKYYFEDFPSCTRWFMYTPTRLMDHFSMMNLKVKPGTLSSEILTILDDSYDFKEKTQSLLDVVKTIINVNEEVGLKYANTLAELREKQIVQVDHIDESIPEAEKEKNSIDFIFQEMIKYYGYETEISRLSKLKGLFQKEEYFDSVINLLQNEIEYVAENERISKDLFEGLDSLISKNS
ncbi:hypothetical protein [Flagellimonas meishanensis]|uniref:hypothetical protein n=1 Tax=Flagellimonas meishanensis TaxID=2873264 RepID=UPI001CA6F290|nr:hypothetical protein [[Muricauda] meishanensis]